MFCVSVRYWETWKVTINPLSANPIKWSNTLKQFVGDHFVESALKGLMHKGMAALYYKKRSKQKFQHKQAN